MAGIATISIKQDRKILFSKARWRANLDVSILGWSRRFRLPGCLALLPDA
jgi:hypothetical protein